MPEPIRLSDGRIEAWVRAAEGGVVESLLVDGRPALARTPWAAAVVPGSEAAAGEADWVARWRGGWQLCFPSTGQPEEGAPTPQGFHGVASQASWQVMERAPDRVRLRWHDDLGLGAERTWRLTGSGLEAVSGAVNEGSAPRRVAVAEHLVLGGDVLRPVLAGARLTLDVPPGSGLAPLDYDGLPAGPAVAWPGTPEARWELVEATTPARVAAVVSRSGLAADARRVTLLGPHVEASVAWSGLPHLLVWEELGASHEAPWNGQVVALGLEPTSTPHGGGTGIGEGIVTLEPGGRMDWWTALSVRWVDA